MRTAELPADITCLHPPYREERPYSGDDAELPPGSLLILELDPAELDAPAIGRVGETVRELRRDLAAAVLVRTSADGAYGAPPTTVAPLLAAGAGVWIPAGEDPYQVARETLPCPHDLAADWLGWTRLHRPIGPRAAGYLACVIRHALDHDSVEDLLREHGEAPRTVRRVLRDEGLPPAGRWLRAARLLHSQLELQRQPDLTLNRAAFSLGYAEAASYSAQHRRVFGVGAGAGRRLLGLEWRYAAFWRRAARG